LLKQVYDHDKPEHKIKRAFVITELLDVCKKRERGSLIEKLSACISDEILKTESPVYKYLDSKLSNYQSSLIKKGLKAPLLANQ